MYLIKAVDKSNTDLDDEYFATYLVETVTETVVETITKTIKPTINPYIPFSTSLDSIPR
jgi:hypothetical protein